MKVAVVVPNWNGKDMLAPCLDSLLSQSLPASVIVVDNGSVDGSVEMIKSRYENITLLENSKNLGFSGGVNVGIKYCLGNNYDYIALFNNDAIADKDWLKNLVEIMDKEISAGIITSRLVRSDRHHLDSTGENYSIYGIPFPADRNKRMDNITLSQKFVFGATGGASLYRAQLLKEIGIFEEKFFAYYEDTDISFRAQLANWKVIFTPKAIAYHEVSATSSKLGSFTRYHSFKNFIMLYVRNMPTSLFYKYLPFFLYQLIRSIASMALSGEFRILLRALLFIFMNLRKIWRDRRKIQATKNVSNTYIDSILYKKRPPAIPRLIN